MAASTFLEALGADVSYYGLPNDITLCADVFPSICYAYQGAPPKSDEVRRTFIFEEAIWEWFYDDSSTASNADTAVANITARIDTLRYIDDEAASDMIEEIQRLASLNPPDSGKYTERYGRPSLPLSSRMLAGGHLEDGHACDCIHDLLGIPKLGDDNVLGKLAYYAKTKDAWTTAAEAQEHLPASLQPDRLPLFKKAALLEEILLW